MRKSSAAIVVSTFICGGLIAGLLIWNSMTDDTGRTGISLKTVAEYEKNSVSGDDFSVSESDICVEDEYGFEEYDINLMMVGDNLMHMGIINTGKQEDGSYDFSILYESMAPFMDEAEIKIINQETILGGNGLGFSGYPKFNSPTEVGDAIADAGFNVVLHASNHAADQGIKGINNCEQFWETEHPEVLMTGIHENEEELNDIPLLTIDGITFAILNYTYGPNMETIPASIMGHLNILCNYNANGLLDFTTLNPQVVEDIKLAEQMADIVIVCPHWGTEYQTTESTYQRQFALEMVEAGADLIIGTHPHVVQPVEWITSENGNRALCYYSLGNYLSTQKDPISMLEGMAWVTFHVTEEDVYIDEENTGVIPLVCQYNPSPVQFNTVYMLKDYNEDLADAHGIYAYGGKILRYSDLCTWSEEIFGETVLSDEKLDEIVNGREKENVID